MIWFNIRQLEKDLADGDLSDHDGFRYLLANMVLFAIVPYLAGDPYQNYRLTIIQFVVDVFITVSLVHATYDINTKGDNRDYFKRFLGLSFVTTMRLIVYLILILLLVEIIASIVTKSDPMEKNVKDILMLLLEMGAGISFYFMLTNSFKRVNGKR